MQIFLEHTSKKVFFKGKILIIYLIFPYISKILFQQINRTKLLMKNLAFPFCCSLPSKSSVFIFHAYRVSWFGYQIIGENTWLF